MTKTLPILTEAEVRQAVIPDDEAGFGSLATTRGHLPLKEMAVHARIDGLLAEVSLSQTFVNTLDEPLEATYIFPLPDRAAVTRFRMEVAGRVIEGVLKERGEARLVYDQAIQAGHRAAITEEERPGVFTMRVGNIMPGEEARVHLSLVGPLPYSDGEVTFRFPLVVAPRYIPGTPLPGPNVGDGVEHDTDAVPDASRITPPVLLPGYPNPVRLTLEVDVAASGLPLGQFRSSLHAVLEENRQGRRHIRLQPGERLDRDFILRFQLGADSVQTSLSLRPDAEGDEGTFLLTLVPPANLAHGQRPRDVVFVLDRSGSMGGWKMVAARRAMARMVDTLTERDRFAVYAFDNSIETPPEFGGQGLVPASNRNRYRAVEFLARTDARGGTEMAQPLDRAVKELAGGDRERDRILVLVTDGQVGNEDQILRNLGQRVKEIRIFTLGIDRAVNAAFLQRLATLGGGACELVESEDRLDEVMDQVHRRIGTAVLTGLRLEPAGLRYEPDTVVPGHTPDLFAGAPLCVTGRYRGKAEGALALQARDAAGAAWSETVRGTGSTNPALAAVWARGHIRELEDRYAIGQHNLERRIVDTSLKFGVLCRFTAFVAVDQSEVANKGKPVHKVVQPVEMPAGWEPPGLVVQRSRVPQQADGALRAMAPGYTCSASGTTDTDFDSDSARGGGLVSRALRGIKRKLVQATPTPVPSAPPDLSPYRQRVRELVEHLKGVTVDRSLCLHELTELAKKLELVVVELRALNVPETEFRTLADLVTELRKVLGRKRVSDTAVSELWSKAVQVLEAFAGCLARPPEPEPQRREGFWK
jgi:Ca-activated chloride channel family protein